MKKRLFILLILCFALASFSGCSSSGDSEIKKLVKSYTNDLYNVDNYETEIDYDKITEKFKPYLTDNSYNEFYAQRLSIMSIDEASKDKYNQKVKDIKMNLSKKGDKEVLVDYEVELERTYTDSNNKEVISKKDSLKVINDNGDWKIQLLQ